MSFSDTINATTINVNKFYKDGEELNHSHILSGDINAKDINASKITIKDLVAERFFSGDRQLSQLLDQEDIVTPALKITADNNDTGIQYGTEGRSFKIKKKSGAQNDSLVISSNYTSPGEKPNALVIKTNGNVGIGNIETFAKLEVHLENESTENPTEWNSNFVKFGKAGKNNGGIAFSYNDTGSGVPEGCIYSLRPGVAGTSASWGKLKFKANGYEFYRQGSTKIAELGINDEKPYLTAASLNISGKAKDADNNFITTSNAKRLDINCIINSHTENETPLLRIYNGFEGGKVYNYKNTIAAIMHRSFERTASSYDHEYAMVMGRGAAPLIGFRIVDGTAPTGIIELRHGQAANQTQAGGDWNNIDFGVSSLEKQVVIKANGNSYFNGGNVGIGTNNPKTKVYIKGNSLIINTENNTKTSVRGGRIFLAGHSGYSQACISGIDYREGVNGTYRGGLVFYVYKDNNNDIPGLDPLYGGNNSLNYAAGSGMIEAMRIKNDGNVGIGTDNPSKKLHIAAESSDALLKIERTGSDSASLFLGGHGGWGNITSSTHLSLKAGDTTSNGQTYNNNPQLFLHEDGNVGIGTSDTTAKLEVHLENESTENPTEWTSNFVKFGKAGKNNGGIAFSYNDTGSGVPEGCMYSLRPNSNWGKLKFKANGYEFYIQGSTKIAELGINNEHPYFTVGEVRILDKDINSTTSKGLYINNDSGSGDCSICNGGGSVVIKASTPTHDFPLEVHTKKSKSIGSYYFMWTGNLFSVGPDGENWNHYSASSMPGKTIKLLKAGKTAGRDVFYRSATQNKQHAISIWSEGMIAAEGFSQSSDERIKINIRDVSDNISLQLLRDISCCYYEYKDPISRNFNTQLGFIAQQVNEHFPQSISLEVEVIPNEMRLIDNPQWTQIIDGSDNKFKLNIPDLEDVSGNTKYKFYMSNDVSGNNEIIKWSSTLENEPKSFIFDQSWNNVFLYGKVVDDFHKIEKNKLFTLNFSATQEIDKIQQKHEQEIAELNNKVISLQNQLETVLKRLDALETN